MAQGKLPPAEYKVFKEYYSHLKSILSAQNLSQYLVSADVITFQDEEEICAARTSFAKANILLKTLIGPLEHGDTYGFYQLLHVMETHGNIATKDLAKKMRSAVSSLQKGQPSSTSNEPAQNASQSAVVSYQSSSLPEQANTMPLVSAPSNPDSYEILDLKEPSMRWMHKIVIPNISFCWKKVADFLDYSIPKKREIDERQRGDPTKCCVELLEDWLSTDNGVKPKTWSKFLSILKEIRELSNTALSIEEHLLENKLISKQ